MLKVYLKDENQTYKGDMNGTRGVRHIMGRGV